MTSRRQASDDVTTKRYDVTTLETVRKAARAVKDSEALVFTAGAGMGVDSGLPDFRGPEGLWRAYPPLRERGLTLPETSNPEWFEKDPRFAWGFFGHRYNLYKRTEPHQGFKILQKWARNKNYFIFTSNVDGHFQKSGFPEENVVECHGSINFMQCTDTRFCNQIWPTDIEIKVDEKTLQAELPLPTGPPGEDKFPARPNILMFGDWGWAGERTDQQESRFYDFQKSCLKARPFVVIEIGAGLAVPTVRYTSETLVERSKAGVLVRINPREPEVSRPEKDLSLALGGLEALKLIDEEIERLRISCTFEEIENKLYFFTRFQANRSLRMRIASGQDCDVRAYHDFMI